MDSRNKFIAGIIAIMSFSCVVHALLLWDGFYGLAADDSGRILEALRWWNDDAYTAGTWLPFYSVTVGMALKVWGDLFVVPRIISGVVGLMILGSLAWLSHELFNNRTITLTTAFLGSVFAPRVILSIAPLSDGMFIFFVVTASAFFLRWIRSGEKYAAVASCALLSAGNSVRYECWMFSLGAFLVIMFLLLRERKVSLSFACLLSIILFVFPLYWVTLHAIQGDPFAFIRDPMERYSLLHGPSAGDRFTNSLLIQFLRQNLTSLNLLGLISLVYLAMRDSPARKWLWMPLLAFIFMSAISFAGRAIPSWGVWRIPSAWSVLLIPFTAHCLFSWRRLLAESEPYWRNTLYGFLISVVMIGFVGQTWSMTRSSGFTRDDLLAGRYLNERLTKSGRSKILIDTSDWPYVNVEVASQHPSAFVHNSGPDPFRPSRPVLDPGKRMERGLLSSLGIGLLAFRAQYMKDYLDTSGVRKETVIGSWAIYAID